MYNNRGKVPLLLKSAHLWGLRTFLSRSGNGTGNSQDKAARGWSLAANL
jgi:hypothetical protein